MVDFQGKRKGSVGKELQSHLFGWECVGPALGVSNQSSGHHEWGGGGKITSCRGGAAKVRDTGNGGKLLPRGPGASGVRIFAEKGGGTVVRGTCRVVRRQKGENGPLERRGKQVLSEEKEKQEG